MKKLKKPLQVGERLKVLACGPVPAANVAYSIRSILIFNGWAEYVRKPSPLPCHKGELVNWLAITPEGAKQIPSNSVYDLRGKHNEAVKAQLGEADATAATEA